MQEDAAIKAKRAAKAVLPYWLHADVVVKCVNRKVADGKYNGQKGALHVSISPSVCFCFCSMASLRFFPSSLVLTYVLGICLLCAPLPRVYAGVVTAVADRYTATVRMLDSGDVLRPDGRLADGAARDWRTRTGGQRHERGR